MIKLLTKYHDYIDVFNKFKINELFSHRFYNHKLKFINEINKIDIFKNRIYFISNHKLKQIKNYFNEYLKKDFIIFNHVLFALLILFIKKINNTLHFYVNYRKLNVLIKRNRYLISLINEILNRI